MTNSHATVSGSAPTPAQMKEFFTQVENGKIDKVRFQEFLRGRIGRAEPGDARLIVGRENFFGPEEWIANFGHQAPLKEVPIPRIPWTLDEITQASELQRHFLFLGNDTLDKKPLNLDLLMKMYGHKSAPSVRMSGHAVVGDAFTYEVSELRWYFMPVGPISNISRMAYKKQVQQISDEYEPETVVTRVLANILYFLINGEYMDLDHWFRTKSVTNDGWRVVINASQPNNIDLMRWADSEYSSVVNLAISRKSWSLKK